MIYTFNINIMHNRQGFIELIRIFKTKISSLYDSQIDSLEKMKWFTEDRGYFETKSKGYDSTMKRTVKRIYYGMSDISKKRELD